MGGRIVETPIGFEFWGIDEKKAGKLETTIMGLYSPGDPSMQIIPTLDPKVCKCYLHWVIWILRVGFRVS